MSFTNIFLFGLLRTLTPTILSEVNYFQKFSTTSETALRTILQSPSRVTSSQNAYFAYSAPNSSVSSLQVTSCPVNPLNQPFKPVKLHAKACISTSAAVSEAGDRTWASIRRSSGSYRRLEKCSRST